MQHPPNQKFERVFSAKEKAALRDEVFVNREFVGVDFTKADLRGTRFERTKLIRCNLAGADLRGAKFVLCELDSVVLADVLLEDNRFDGTTLVEVVGLNPADHAIIEQSGGTFLHAHASHR